MSTGREDDVAGCDAPAYSTGWVARRLGIAPATLRTWHYRYRISPMVRTPGGHRRYRPQDVDRLERMRSLVLAGLPTAEAARVSAYAGSEPEPGAPPGRATQRRGRGRTAAPTREAPEVRRLAGAAMALDQPGVASLLTEALRRCGVAPTWEQLIVPVLADIGDRYARRGDCIDVEHLFTDCVRTALSVVGTRRRQWDGYPPVLLGCLDQEQHSLALHALAAALTEISCPSLILGASVPPDALISAARRTHPRAVFVWAQTAATARLADLQALPRRRPPTPVVVGGPGWRDQDLPARVTRVDSLTAAIHATSRDLGTSHPR